MNDLDRAIARAEDAQRQRNEYMAEHRDELDRLPRVEAAFDARLAQLIDTDIAEPPSYLRALGVPPQDAESRAKWRDAAESVEHYRIVYGINDRYQPLGPEPAGDAGRLWRAATEDLKRLTEQARTPTRDLGVAMDL